MSSTLSAAVLVRLQCALLLMYDFFSYLINSHPDQNGFYGLKGFYYHPYVAKKPQHKHTTVPRSLFLKALQGLYCNWITKN